MTTNCLQIRYQLWLYSFICFNNNEAQDDTIYQLVVSGNSSDATGPLATSIMYAMSCCAFLQITGGSAARYLFTGSVAARGTGTGRCPTTFF